MVPSLLHEYPRFLLRKRDPSARPQCSSLEIGEIDLKLLIPNPSPVHVNSPTSSLSLLNLPSLMWNSNLSRWTWHASHIGVLHDVDAVWEVGGRGMELHDVDAVCYVRSIHPWIAYGLDTTSGPLCGQRCC